MGCKSECKTCGSHISVPSSYMNCPDPCHADAEKCSELFKSDCILYTGESILELNIEKNQTRMTEVVQKLALLSLNPDCSNFDTTEHSAFNIFFSDIEQTAVTVSWNGASDTEDYTLEFKTEADVSWNSISSITDNSQIITGLTPGTTYEVRVLSNFETNPSCVSLIYKFKTLE